MCEANRFKYKGNWKLAYDNSGDGYHVIYSHQSLLETENRFKDEEPRRACPITSNNPTSCRCTSSTWATAIISKTSGQICEKRPGGLWAIESLHPGMEHVAEKLRAKYGDKAEALLDLAGSEPVNINVFPNLSLLGNHIQVFQPVSYEETDAIWYGTKDRRR